MSAFEADPFFQYARTAVATSEGNVDLPFFVYEASIFSSGYWIDLERAQALVVNTGLEAVRFENGKALIGVNFYDYRNTSVGSYREVATAVAVVPKGLTPPRFPFLSLFGNMDKVAMGFYIFDLPVTTAAADVAGREIWGLPKFVTQIDFARNGERFEIRVTDPDTKDTILKFSGVGGVGAPGPLFDAVLLSSKHGKILRTVVTTRGGAKFRFAGSIRLEVSDIQHPMAQRLIALGLKDAQPSFFSQSDKLQMRLSAGAPLP